MNDKKQRRITLARVSIHCAQSDGYLTTREFIEHCALSRIKVESKARSEMAVAVEMILLLELG